MTDFLIEDTLLPDEQKWVCLSFLTPKHAETKSTLSGIKIRGVFSTYELACEHAKKLQSVDPAFNVFVGEMGKWLPFDPDPDSKYVKDSEYANEELNNMMKKYRENQEKAKLLHEHKKNEKILESLDSNLDQRRKNRKELVDQLEDNEDKEKLMNNIKAIDEEIKKLENKMKEINEVDSGLKKKLKIE